MKRIAFWIIAITGWALLAVYLFQPSLIFPGKQVSSRFHGNYREAWYGWKQLPINFDTLLPGDMIVRAGTGYFSSRLQEFGRREQLYSHCGLITRGKDGKNYVLHAIGGEGRTDNSIRCDSLFTFSNPIDNERIAIYRFPLSPHQRVRMDSLARVLHRNKVQFDLKFDLDNDDELYCTEFVYKTLVAVYEEANTLELPVGKDNKRYISVDDIYFLPGCKKLVDFNYLELFPLNEPE